MRELRGHQVRCLSLFCHYKLWQCSQITAEVGLGLKTGNFTLRINIPFH